MVRASLGAGKEGGGSGKSRAGSREGRQGPGAETAGAEPHGRPTGPRESGALRPAAGPWGGTGGLQTESGRDLGESRAPGATGGRRGRARAGGGSSRQRVEAGEAGSPAPARSVPPQAPPPSSSPGQSRRPAQTSRLHRQAARAAVSAARVRRGRVVRGGQLSGAGSPWSLLLPRARAASCWGLPGSRDAVLRGAEAGPGSVLLGGLVTPRYKWGSVPAPRRRPSARARATCGGVATDRAPSLSAGSSSPERRGEERTPPSFLGKGAIRCRGCGSPRWGFQNRHHGFRNKKQTKNPNEFPTAVGFLGCGHRSGPKFPPGI